MQVIAIDWSGRAQGAQKTIWTAIVKEGRLVALEDGRGRKETIDAILPLAHADPKTVVGLDFAFSFPRWYCEREGWRSGRDVWQAMRKQAETLLAACEPPFWGRPGTKAQQLGDPFRQAERTTVGQPKSVFQIGGAGAVGTGSLRGMPHLLDLSDHGFAIWPFDPPGWPLAIEIYPRVFTPSVIKSRQSARRAHLDQYYPDQDPVLMELAAASEDAFDATVSALAMAQATTELACLPSYPAEDARRIEGCIWTPRSESGRAEGNATVPDVTAPQVPPYTDLLWPTLCAVREIGDSGTIREIVERVVEREQFSEELQQVLHGEGPSTELEYRLAWARTYLKGMGLLVNSSRGVWSTTELGRSATVDDLDPLHSAYVARVRDARREKESSDPDPGDGSGSGSGSGDGDVEFDGWKEHLLDVLLDMDPADFERLAGRLLREAGFISVSVTGKSGDGGIDGIGVYRLSLVSFPVFFQCKRYSGSVGANAVRDFRGAMAGRGDKGLLITTGSFTREARSEATRDGAPPIDLIDGDRLCDLLKEYELGVAVERRTVETVTVHPERLDEI
jgi:restriction system protein